MPHYASSSSQSTHLGKRKLRRYISLFGAMLITRCRESYRSRLYRSPSAWLIWSLLVGSSEEVRPSHRLTISPLPLPTRSMRGQLRRFVDLMKTRYVRVEQRVQVDVSFRQASANTNQAEILSVSLPSHACCRTDQALTTSITRGWKALSQQ